jgi:hypothetical protein
LTLFPQHGVLTSEHKTHNSPNISILTPIIEQGLQRVKAHLQNVTVDRKLLLARYLVSGFFFDVSETRALTLCQFNFICIFTIIPSEEIIQEIIDFKRI